MARKKAAEWLFGRETALAGGMLPQISAVFRPGTPEYKKARNGWISGRRTITREKRLAAAPENAAQARDALRAILKPYLVEDSSISDEIAGAILRLAQTYV